MQAEESKVKQFALHEGTSTAHWKMSCSGAERVGTQYHWLCGAQYTGDMLDTGAVTAICASDSVFTEHSIWVGRGNTSCKTLNTEKPPKKYYELCVISYLHRLLQPHFCYAKL